MSFGMKQHGPITIHEAVSSAIELESYLLKSASCNVRQVTEKEPDREATVAMIQSTQRGLMEMSQRNKQPPRSSQPTDRWGQ